MIPPEAYTIISSLFPRLLGMIYFFAFFPFIFQIKGLVGEKGILPAQQYLEVFRKRMGKRRYFLLPTLFWLNCSDRALVIVPVIGSVLSVLLMLGVCPPLLLAVLILLHLSIVTIGQDFLGFGWEGFFLELSYHALLMSLTVVPNIFVWLSVNVLIFRMHLQAGTCKLMSGDPSWKNLTALCVHYQTQPIPSTLAWYAHKLPVWFQKLSVAAMLAAEIVLPFLVFGIEQMRLIAFAGFFGLQFFIWVSGNYSYLNYLTSVAVSLLISNTYLSGYISAPDPASHSWVISSFISLGGIGLLAVQLLALWYHFFRTPWLNRLFRNLFPYHLGNRFGIFAVMTTERYEVVLEGSMDGEQWEEFLFWFKPSEPERRPRRIAPFQPRLDWQAWFLPFTTFENSRWFQQFVVRILEDSPEVRKLVRFHPFPGHPPKFLRAKLYLYEFTPWGAKNWWKRKEIGEYMDIKYIN